MTCDEEFDDMFGEQSEYGVHVHRCIRLCDHLDNVNLDNHECWCGRCWCSDGGYA